MSRPRAIDLPPVSIPIEEAAAVRARAGREIEEGARGRSRVSHRILVRAAPVGSPARPRADQRLVLQLP